MNSKPARNCIVILCDDAIGQIYLGEIDAGVRQGVRRLSNAVRFTKVGAARVASAYSDARVVEVA